LKPGSWGEAIHDAVDARSVPGHDGRLRTTPPAGGRRLVAVDGKTLTLAGILHLTGAAKYHHRAAAPRSTTSPTAADPQDPLINNPCPRPCCWGRSRNLLDRNRYVISIPIYRFRARPPALHPWCYQLSVACNLSDRRLLINDFARALPTDRAGEPHRRRPTWRTRLGSRRVPTEPCSSQSVHLSSDAQ
jgi:hypothetical protein